MPKISALPTLTAPAKQDSLAIVDESEGATKQVTLETLFNLIYPVGSIYTNAVDDTDPATLIGVGTWEPFAQGRMLVGLKDDDASFNAAGLTGGQKSMQAHTHANRWRVNFPRGDGGLTVNDLSGDASLVADGMPLGNTAVGYDDPTNRTLGLSAGTGANNMNPYVVVHMWKRTA